MRHIAIIGSGPAGYYTAEAAQKRWGEAVRVDVFDRLPVPFGLVRSGVAPDHQSIKSVVRRYETTALTENVRFVGNVTLGEDVGVAELQALYDAVILATGAPEDRALGLEDEDLGNVFGSAAFVGWYNGHPQFARLDPNLFGQHAVIIGMGNVALDVARILARTEREFAASDIVAQALGRLMTSGIETITLLGRRGPQNIQMTPKELGELNHLERAHPQVDPADLSPIDDDAMLDPGLRKSVAHLRSFAAVPQIERALKPVGIHFDFYASPKALRGADGKVHTILVERTAVTGGRAIGTGETYELPADLVVSCIGYRTTPIPDVPYDQRSGHFSNTEGRIAPGLYCVGWAKRGPSGTIGTNRPDGYAVMDLVAADIGTGAGKRGRDGFDELAQARGLDVVTFSDWQMIEQAEVAAAREGAPREKFIDIASMIAARGPQPTI